MSIIERVAKLLESTEKESSGRARSESVGVERPGLIERNVGGIVPEGKLDTSDRSLSRQGATTQGQEVRIRESAVHPIDSAPAAFRKNRRSVEVEPDRSTRVVGVDRNHLRRNGMVQPDGVRSPVGECIRLIKSQLLHNIQRNQAGSSPSLIMVTSALPGEGKTFCAVNLAISIALERDRSVVLVDGDVANPTVPDVLGLDASKGLMDALLDPQIDINDLLVKTDIGNLEVLTSGTSHDHATELLASEAMRGLAETVAMPFNERIVIFDSPPLLVASEASALAHHMEQIVVIVEQGKTLESALRDALDRIDTSKVAGLVLNKGRAFRRGYGYGYGYGGHAGG